MAKANTTDRIILPEKYYLDYFRYVSDFIRQMYPDMLGPQADFLAHFEALSEPAQCLYLRINGRKGSYFRPSKLKYSEIPDMSTTVEELIREAFVRLADEDDLPEWITPIFTKQDLYNWLKDQEVDELPVKSASRAAVESIVHDHFDIASFQRYDQIIVQEQLEHMDMIRIMFFGDPYGDLNQFVVRDVGNVKIPHQKQSDFKPIFDHREQMDELLQVLQWYREFKLLQAEEYSAEVVWQWLDDKQSTLSEIFDTSRVVADKFLLKVGQQLEREDMLTQAAQVYGWSNRPEAYERRLRSLIKLEDHERALEQATLLADEGINASLKLLGKDYLRKHGDKRIRRGTTDRIKQAELVDVVYSTDTRIERLVLEHLASKGYSGFFSENFIWRSLFGLLFWDQLYAKDAVMNQPLQRLPSDIYSSFYKNNEVELKAHLDQFENVDQMKKWVLVKYGRVQGEGNPFVHWHEELELFLKSYFDWLNVDQISAVVLEMTKNPKENCTGFPDLFVFKDLDYSFYEVKSPNDHLSPQQLFWIDFFEEHQINVEILRTK